MDIRRDVALAPYTTFGIGGPADYFVVARTQEDIVEAFNFARDPSAYFHSDVSGQAGEVKPLPVFILGTGANILIGDKGYRGLVIKNEAKKYQISNIEHPVSNNSSLRATEGSAAISKIASSQAPHNDAVLLTAESGATIEELITYTSEKGLSGLEHFAGIPSSVGGALWQNLHFLSPDRSKTVFIGDIVTEAVILVSEAKSQTVPGEAHPGSDSGQTSATFSSSARMTKKEVHQSYFQFSYDYSVLHDTHDVVLSATFLLTPEDPNIIQERIAANLAWRAEKHPKNAVKTSAGSIFKKIEGYGAGRLIERVGLKGHHIGGAKISEEHANFILNENGASAKDVMDLITIVKKKVKEELNLDMQTEISFVGEF